MARITRAGGVTDVRAVPERTSLPSVDAMLRRPEQADDADDDVEVVDDDGATERPSVDTELAGGEVVEEEPGEVPDAGSEDGGGGSGEETAAPSTADVRAWAREHEFEVADAGPIPKHVQQAYDDAHPAAEPEG